MWRFQALIDVSWTQNFSPLNTQNYMQNSVKFCSSENYNCLLITFLYISKLIALYAHKWENIKEAFYMNELPQKL